MAYGIRFTTPTDDRVQIDSDSTNSGMIVVDSNFTGATTLPNVNLNNDMVFARPSQITIGTFTIAMVNTTGNTYQFVDVNGNAVSCRYVRGPMGQSDTGDYHRVWHSDLQCFKPVGIRFQSLHW